MMSTVGGGEEYLYYGFRALRGLNFWLCRAPRGASDSFFNHSLPCLPRCTADCSHSLWRHILLPRHTAHSSETIQLWKSSISSNASTSMPNLAEQKRVQTKILLIVACVIGTVVLYLGIHSVILFALGQKPPALLPTSSPCPILDSSMLPSQYRFLYPKPPINHAANST